MAKETREAIRDWLMIAGVLVFIWFYSSNWVVQNFIEKAQLAQKVQMLEKQLAEKAKEEKK